MATPILDVMAQYNQELDLLMQVYQQRFAVECATLPEDLASLCIRLRTNEWVRGDARKNAVAVILKLDPIAEESLFDIVLEKITPENIVLDTMQSDIALTLGFSDADTPIRDLKTCLEFIQNASPVSASSCNYIVGFLDNLAAWQKEYDAILSRDKTLYECRYAQDLEHTNCLFEPEPADVMPGCMTRYSTPLQPRCGFSTVPTAR